MKDLKKVFNDYINQNYYPNTITEEESAYETFIVGYNCRISEIESLYEEIKHGDVEHKLWLKNKIEEHFNIKVPESKDN